MTEVGRSSGIAAEFITNLKPICEPEELNIGQISRLCLEKKESNESYSGASRVDHYRDRF